MTKQIIVLRNLRILTDNIEIWTALYMLEQPLYTILRGCCRLHPEEVKIEQSPLWRNIQNSVITLADRFILHNIFTGSIEYVSGLSAQLSTVTKAIETKFNLSTAVVLPSKIVKNFQKSLKKLYKIIRSLENDPETLLGCKPRYKDVMSFFDNGLRNDDNTMFRAAIQTFIASQDARKQRKDFNEDEYWKKQTVQSEDKLRAWLRYLFRDVAGAPNFIEKTKETPLAKRVIIPITEATQCTRIAITTGAALISIISFTFTTLTKRLNDECPLCEEYLNCALLSVCVVALVVCVLCIVLMIKDCIGGCCHKRPDDQEPDEHTPLRQPP